MISGMEDLIKQAFLHVDVIGPHVQEGHYDLIGPNGEIVLPQVWEIMIKPEWAVAMHMWPIPQEPRRFQKPPPLPPITPSRPKKNENKRPIFARKPRADSRKGSTTSLASSISHDSIHTASSDKNSNDCSSNKESISDSKSDDEKHVSAMGGWMKKLRRINR
ncbi:hypothetical protein NHQ30_008327 [Ciborinia camelliae]|nr:hypothetical protein NHQ30_008327 [Ciborinia camelliae]